MVSATETAEYPTAQKRHNGSRKYIFWPRNIRSDGFLYGWCFEDGTICVAGVLEKSTIEQASAKLRKCTTGSRNEDELHYRDVKILGTCHRSGGDVSTGDSLDGLLSIEIKGNMPQAPDELYHFILYQPPDSRKLRFFSLQPLELGTTTYSLVEDDAVSIGRKSAHTADLTGVFPDPKAGYLDLVAVVTRLNAVKMLQRYVQSDSTINSPDQSKSSVPRAHVFHHILQPFEYLIWVWLCILNFRPLGRNSLRDISATAHQLDVRLRQAYSAPASYQTIYRASGSATASSRAQYITFYNMLWLIANDVIIGSAVTAFCLENNQSICSYLSRALHLHSIKGLQDILGWLNNWPGGLKLNYELGTFFCDAFLWFTSVWQGIFLDRILLPNLPLVVTLIGYSASAGTTLFLALCSDLLSLSTLHLYLFYSMATAVFSFHTSAMGSLFNIFRGKKRNVIRNRVEPSTYTLDQLLIGAILFTLAAFLLPTVLAFYLVFATSRCAIIAIHAMLEGVLAFLNHFPLFAMMLRLKDPERLPGGLDFTLLDEQEGQYLALKNNPIPASAIFHQYWALWSSFSQHYSPIYLIGKVVAGRYINPIPRSRLTFVAKTGSAGTN